MIKHFCDICGREIDTVKSKPILISFDGFYKNDRVFDICTYCEDELEKAKKSSRG